MRAVLADALKSALKTQDKLRISTLRLIHAAIQDRDIANRGAAKDPVSDEDILQILTKMVKQRQESARAYEEGGRLELAEKENAEILVVEEFLPRKMSAEETRAALDEVVTSLGATSVRDMGRVMAELKARYTGQMDFGAVGQMVKEKLL